DQAGLGRESVGTAAEDISGELEVVGRRIVASQAQAKAVFPARRAVAGALVAAADVHGRDQIVTEADRLRLVEALHRYRHARDLTACFDDQRRLAVLSGSDVTVAADGNDVFGLSDQVT